MHMLTVLSNQLQDTHSLAFFSHSDSSSYKQINSTKIISCNTSLGLLMLKFIDVLSNFI